jgi:hypothetical protein
MGARSACVGGVGIAGVAVRQLRMPERGVRRGDVVRTTCSSVANWPACMYGAALGHAAQPRRLERAASSAGIVGHHEAQLLALRRAGIAERPGS